MILNISGLNFYIEQPLNSKKKQSSSNKKNVLLIHGFTGTSKDWSQIIPKLSQEFNYYALDFIGHGGSDSPLEKNFYTTASIVEQLKELLLKISGDKFIILGYSMGGRAALSIAINHPELVDSLILESSTAGIKDETERKERRKKDEDLALFIENNSMEEFIKHWMNMEIFNTQKRFSNLKLEAIKKSKLINSKIGLANSLRGFGTGNMPDYFNDLNNLKTRTLLISGDLDEKFTLINQEMVKLIPSAEHALIKNSGHNTHLETPSSFIEIINRFLNSK